MTFTSKELSTERQDRKGKTVGKKVKVEEQTKKDQLCIGSPSMFQPKALRFEIAFVPMYISSAIYHLRPFHSKIHRPEATEEGRSDTIEKTLRR